MGEPPLTQDQEKALRKLLNRNPNPLEEDQVKQLLQRYLESQGWQVNVKWGQTKGIDIEATNATAHWIIEAKGWAGGSEQQQGNYFWAAIAEVLQRMASDDAKYSLAFPAFLVIGDCGNDFQILPSVGREYLAFSWINKAELTSRNARGGLQARLALSTGINQMPR